MQYDLNLSPWATQRIEVAGKFFKYIGTGKVKVTTDKGGAIELESGQGVWGEQFSGLSVSDRSGSANTGVLLAGNYDFRDDTVTGRVEVTNKLLNTSGVTIAMEKSWSTINTTINSGQAVIPAADNPFGVIINKIQLWRSSTGGALNHLYAIHPTTLDQFTIAMAMAVSGSYVDPMIVDFTQYEIPSGYEVRISWAVSNYEASRLVCWTKL